MKINRNIYPYNPDPERFPIYLTGIGGSEYQGHVNRPEGYQWHQILHCAHGVGHLIYDNKAVDICAGDYFFVPANYASEYYSDNAMWDVRWVAFDGYALEILLKKFEMTKPIVFHCRDDEKLTKLFEKMVASQLNERMISDYVCSGLIYEYIIQFHLEMETDSLKAQRNKYNILLPAIAYIEGNLDKDISITELAEISEVSHQHLCRLFKETMNIRPVEYITKRRIEKAKELLRDNDMSIAEITVALGFASPSYFSTIFKKYEGITPNSFRKTM